MDTDANAEDSADIQESLMGALIGSRGVPGGLQGVSGQSEPAATEGDLSPETAALLGISTETLAAVKQPSPDTDNEMVPEPVIVEPELAVSEAVVPEEVVVPPAPQHRVPPVPPDLGSPEAVVPDAPALASDGPLPAPEDDIEPAVDIKPAVDIDDPNPDGLGRVILEWAVVLIGAVVMALVLRQFIFQAFWIPSESMETTLEISDRVLVNRLSYQWGDVGRGDVVVFERKPEEVGEIRDLIKRVIGLPGDTVEGRDNVIFINGTRLDEPYVDPENQVFSDFGPTVVPENELFVMGDNRDQSFDSRLFGTVDVDRVAGRAFVTFWPLSRAGSL